MTIFQLFSSKCPVFTLHWLPVSKLSLLPVKISYWLLSSCFYCYHGVTQQVSLPMDASFLLLVLAWADTPGR